MIKCPYCGSTAQVKVIGKYFSKMCQSDITEYQCGCGCFFEIEKMPNGIINGKWQVREKEDE